MSEDVPCQGLLRPCNGSWTGVHPGQAGTHGLAR
jgi:hypothetical protein